MAHYSVATTKDKLSSLIDKALAGEEVVITRHGKPVAEINRPRDTASSMASRAAAMEKLRAWQRAAPPMRGTPIPYERFYEWLYEDEE